MLSERTKARAAEWICDLRNEVQRLKLEWHQPEMYILTTSAGDDEFVFEWHRGQRSLSFYVLNSDVEFLRSWGYAPDRQVMGKVTKLEEAIDVYLWLLDGKER